VRFVAVRDITGRMLLVRRCDTGDWELPGGHVDPGESAAGAAVRETAEESGITVEITGLVGIYTDPGHVIADPRDGQVRQPFAVCFHARPLSGSPGGDQVETSDARWFALSDIPALPIRPAMRLRPFPAARPAPISATRPAGSRSARRGASAGSRWPADRSRRAVRGQASSRGARWNSPRSAPAARTGGPWASRRPAPADLLRSELQATAALVFAHAVPGGMEPGLDQSRSYAEWLSPRLGPESHA